MLTILTILPLCIVVGMLGMRLFKIRSHPHSFAYTGVEDLQRKALESKIYILRLSRYLGKSLQQYLFHFAVRILYYIRLFFHILYALARNKFFKNAIKDKKTVSKFWEHLKEYKQQIDSETK
jgi:hypothetical protein